MTARKKTADEAPAVVDEAPAEDETSAVDENPDVDASTDERPVEDVNFADREFVRDPSEVDPAGKTEQEVRDELMGADPVDVGNRSSYPDEVPAPVDTTPPAATYVDEPGRAVTMADVASLNGIGIAPDASRVREVDEADAPFISEGMRNDLEMYGRALDPATGKLVVRRKVAE